MKHIIRIIVATILYFVLMAGAFVALGDDLPNAPKPKLDSVRAEVTHHASKKIFWTGVAFIAAAKTTDALSTERILNMGLPEGDPVFGRRPSPARVAAVNAGFFAAETILFHFTESSRHPLVRWAGRVNLSFSVIQHARFAACNYSSSLLSGPCPSF